jgi:hypothetical protein
MLQNILNELESLRRELTNHSLYKEVRTTNDIQLFTEQHVFAVWDFMSLLKSLQAHLTCIELPWTPSPNPVTRRFINEIVFCEESDIDQDGKTMSHYEMYLVAMKQIGADTSRMDNFCDLIKKGNTLDYAFQKSKTPKSVQDFVNFTFEVIASKKPHIIAAVFTFGREDLIPDMFIEIVKRLGGNTSIDKLVYYLERHIELDGDEHGPISLKMVEELCGNDALKWDEALLYSKKALQHRISLWDNIALDIKENKCELA